MIVRHKFDLPQLANMVEKSSPSRDRTRRTLMSATFFEQELLQQPSLDEFSCILQKHKREGHRTNALHVHALLCKSGLESCTSLGSHLVCTLVDFGAMHEAQQVFDRLVLRSELSWNSLITGYINCGKPQHAFILYQKMQEDDLPYPNAHAPTVVSLLKVSAKLKDFERGLKIHADVARTGLLERDIYIGSALLDMYLTCGMIVKAREAFDDIPVRNVVLWTALIAGYAKHGHGEEALKCFEEMQVAGFTPDPVTYICSLKACGITGVANKGCEIHVELERKGFLRKDAAIGNSLIDMYAKCGLLAQAQDVFDNLPVKNVVSWTALITGYADCGYGDKALYCLKQMQLEGVTPNVVTFISCLKACGTIGAIDEGCEIHAQMERNGLTEGDLVVGCTLVDMYAKCGRIFKAQEVFDKLPVRNIVLWNALTGGYAECGYIEEALSCLDRMRQEGVSPDAVTFISILKACGIARAIEKGVELHAEIERKGLLERDRFVGSSLLDMYAQCGLLAKAREVFDKLPVRNIVIWNALLMGFVENGCGEEALNYYEKMHGEGIHPDVVTFLCGLKACSSIGALNKGEEIHSDIVRQGVLEMDVVIGNALVDMYAKCGSLVKSQEVFDKISGHDTVSWNALITGYAQDGQGEQALECFEQMQLKGKPPDSVTFISSLKACGSIGAMDKGQAIHVEIERKGLLRSDLLIGTALVDMYAKHGSMIMAHQVFYQLPGRGVIVWNSLISGYAQLGKSEHVFSLFETMVEEGIKPSLVTFVVVLNACSQTGLFEKGETYFKTMSKHYGVVPTSEHQICMVDLHGRAGHMDKAVSMIKKLSAYPDLSVWHTILGACSTLGVVKLAKEAFGLAMRLDEKDASVYALMSAAASMQDESNKTGAMNAEKHSLTIPKTFWWSNNDDVLLSHSLAENDYCEQKGG